MSGSERLRVFIIDDNEMTRTVLRMIIQSDAFEVVGGAADGKSGLERVRALRPDIVCLDVVLPECNGLDLLAEIKTDQPGVTVLMVSASNDRTTVHAAIAGGAAGFIVKPFNPGGGARYHGQDRGRAAGGPIRRHARHQLNVRRPHRCPWRRNRIVSF